jgi:hypothetical protein
MARTIQELANEGIIDVFTRFGKFSGELEEGKSGIIVINEPDELQDWEIEALENDYEVFCYDSVTVDYDNQCVYIDSRGLTRYKDAELLTPESDISDWIDYALVDRELKTYPILPEFIDNEDIIKEGFELLYDGEPLAIGLHEHQNSSPTLEFKKRPGKKFVFKIESSDMFSTYYLVFVKIEE